MHQPASADVIRVEPGPLRGVLSHRATPERPAERLSGRRKGAPVAAGAWGAAYDALRAHHGSAAAVSRLMGASKRAASDWGRRAKRPTPERQAQLLELAAQLPGADGDAESKAA